MSEITTEVRTFTGIGKDGHRHKLYSAIDRDSSGNITAVAYGKSNQPPRAKEEKGNCKMNNGWNEIKRGPGGSNYSKYGNQIVVLVPDEKNKDHVCITRAGWEALGKPHSVKFFTRGTNVGIMGAENGDGYKVSSILGREDSAILYTSPSRWRKTSNIRPGVYEAHLESGMIVFDSAQSPSKL